MTKEVLVRSNPPCNLRRNITIPTFAWGQRQDGMVIGLRQSIAELIALAMPLLILADHVPDIAMVFFQPLSQGWPDVKTDRTKHMSFRELLIAFGKNLLIKIVVLITGGFSGNQASKGIRARWLIHMQMQAQVSKSVGNGSDALFRPKWEMQTGLL